MARDRSPDYYSGGAAYDPAPYPADAPPFAPPPPRDTMSLQVPSSRHRPRSVPPFSGDVARRHRSRSPSPTNSRSPSPDGSRSPIGKAQHAVKETFTHTPSGIGIGLLGAIVGGLAAREASSASARARNRRHDSEGGHNHHSSSKDNKSKILSTFAGAIVGGLGANAIEKRFEVARGRDKERQDAWERRWGKESDLPHYDTGDDRERDHGHGHGNGRRHHGDDDGYSDGGDYIYEERRSSHRMRSEDPPRFRN